MAALRVQLVDLVEPGPALGGDVHLAADDRLDPLRLAGAVKVHGTVHDAVVRDSAGGLAHGLHDAGQVPDAAAAVQKAELGMDMEMDKRHSMFLSKIARAVLAKGGVLTLRA